MLLSMAELQKRKELDMKLFYDNYQLVWSVDGTKFQGRIKLSKSRVRPIELMLHCYQVVCDISVKLGNHIRRMPPTLNVTCNVELTNKHEEVYGLMDLVTESVSNIKTIEVLIALAYSAQRRATFKYDECLYLADIESYPVFQQDEQHLMFALTTKPLAINKDKSFLAKHRISPHFIYRFMQRHSGFDRSRNAIDQIIRMLETTDFKIINKPDGNFMELINEKTGYAFVACKFNKQETLHRLLLVTLKRDYYDFEPVNSYFDEELEKFEKLVTIIPI
ncbi:restriction endonuclease subunit S domain-containing protein [Vibrio gangliei]|uniref:hypothetical protein n=1 Tax=Vibrio gangliei TaxID=2077090 RepID=UPI000D014C76|nr:hypothetical protein [Vibrio gangliei]